MSTHELTQFVGRHCQVMVDCPACGRTHGHEGKLALSRRPGEIEVDGHVFDLTEVRALHPAPVSETESHGFTISAPMLRFAIQAMFILSMLVAFRASIR